MSNFTSGNIVAYRIGTVGAALTNAATAVFLDEYTSSGMLVQSIAMPTSATGANFALVGSGTATSEGILNLSTDGKYLLLTGFDAALGTPSVNGSAASTQRVVARVGADGTVDTSTALSVTGDIRSAASADGSAYYVGTSANTYREPYGALAGTTLAAQNTRDVEIFGGQVYYAAASTIGTLGAGTPTSGTQTATPFSFSVAPGSSLGDFFLADLDDTAGVDTLYLVDSTNGLEKYSLVGGTWTRNGATKTLTDGTAVTGYEGLTASVSGSTVTVYVTTPTRILSLTDTAGYNQALSSTALTSVVDHTSGFTGTAFRGVSFTPTSGVAPAVPTLSIDSPTIVEGNDGTSTLLFTVTASEASASAITVDFATADGTAFAGSDYVATSGTLTIAAGQTSGQIAITINGDRVIEQTEALSLNLTNATHATLGGAASGTGTIQNDDFAGTFGLSGEVSGSEAANAQVFTIVRSGGDVGAATISYAVAGSGTNSADAADFGGALPGGTVTFADGQTSATISIPVSDDATFEPDETYTLTLTGTDAGAIGTATATGTIANDDASAPAGTFGLAGDVSSSEDGGGQTFTVTRTGGNGGNGGPATISYAVAGSGTNVADAVDFGGALPTGKVTFADGETTKTITIPVSADAAYEADETYTLTLTGTTAGAIGQATATGTIENDDPVPDAVQIFSANFDSFTAAGFAPGATAASGQLDSNIWRVVGLSDQTNPAYGFTGPAAGDFGRGVINGSADPVTAGVYSPSANHALVLQPTGAELDNNGFVEARIQNTSGATATSFDVAFDWAFRNSGGRSANLQLAYSTDGTNFTPVTDANFSTPGAADAAVASTFSNQHEIATINGTVASGGYLYLRWINTGSTGGGSRDEVGIDNVDVTAHLSTTSTASVTGGSFVEGNDGTTDAVFTITRSNGAGIASIDYATADGTALAGSDYLATAGTVTFAAGETSKTVTVKILGNTVHEADENFRLNLSNPVGFEVPQPTATATIANDDTGPVAIYDIQGLGHRSAFTGQTVSTSGVVTSVKSNGFYLQDATGDGNVATSDAIFVFTSSAPTVSVGNAITLSGTVAEFASATNQLTTTELSNPTNIVVTGAFVALPAAVVIATDGSGRTPPTSVIDDDDFTSFDPANDGADFYESLEGMRVTIQQPLVVADTDANGQTFVVASNGAGATGLNAAGGMTISNGDNNPETIKIYEGPSAAGTHAQGEKLNDVTGILNYFGGRYELDPTSGVTTAVAAPVRQRETTTLIGDANNFSYASFNIENFSPRDQDYDAPLTAAIKVQRLATEIVGALGSPNVIGLQEVQDNDGEGTGSDLSGAANVQRLVDEIAAQGGPTYKYVEIAPATAETSGGAPGGNIRNGFLYDPAKVAYVDGSARVLTDAAFNGTRRPLVADFVFNGQTFTAIDQHSTSRGGSDPVYSSNEPPVQAGDAGRTAQATAIRNYVDGVLASDPAHNFIVNGDFNGFPYEQALATLTAGSALDNLYDKLPTQEQYSYYFDGYYQAFDNIIVSGQLYGKSNFDIVHYNAGFTDGYSVTDHDQAVATIGLARDGGTATAVADTFDTTAAAVLHGTVLANDTGGNGTITVAAFNGDTGAFGGTILASGAYLNFASNGVFTYDPNGAFAGVTAGATGTDSFTYMLADGSSTTVTIRVAGVSTPAPNAGGVIQGTSGNDTYSGTTGDDRFDMSQGGKDMVDAGGGNDTIRLGMAFTAADRINGGTGTDTVQLTGDYTGADALVLSATTLTNVETLQLGQGFGYAITTSDATVAAGQSLTVDAGTLGGLDGLTFDGSAEKDGSFAITGGAGKDTLTGGAQNDTLTGGKGDDTYYVANSGDKVVEKQNEGNDTVYASASFDLFQTFVETLRLTGNGNLDAYGNGQDNALYGNDGNNILDGRAGADTMVGGKGDDTYYIDNAIDRIVEAAGEGVDTVYTSTSFDLNVNANVEVLRLTGTGNLTASGSAAAETIYGNSGNNIIYDNFYANVPYKVPGTDQDIAHTAPDVLVGSKGDDTYYVSNSADKVIELQGEGNDTIFSQVSYDLAGTFVETLQLTGVQHPPFSDDLVDAINVFGNGQANKLYGNQGNNILDGRGGADYLAGGKGDDTYYVDNVGDQVIEKAGEGNDTVNASISYDLSGTNIETLRLTGTSDIDAFGGNGADTLYGNAGSNILNGRGGADVMAGGKGDDTYYVDSSADKVIELADDGNDTVYASADFDLYQTFVETLRLTGSGNLNAFGNSQANSLYGNDSNNVLTGRGGNDLLDGGIGSDTAAYAGKMAGYQIVTAGGELQVKDIDATNGDEGTDTLVGIEKVRFADQTLSVASPIVLDLAGTGVALTSLASSNAAFDLDGDGLADKTSWFGRGSALLFLDRNGDGTLSNAGEMSFTDDKAGAKSDLDGLSGFDTDGDGKLSAADSQFDSFKLFVDANGDGRVDAGEVKTLADLGVASLTLAGTAVNATWTFGDAMVVNTGSFTHTDGSTSGFADVAFSYQSGASAAQTAAQQFAEAAAVFTAAQHGSSELSDALEKRHNELPTMQYAVNRAV